MQVISWESLIRFQLTLTDSGPGVKTCDVSHSLFYIEFIHWQRRHNLGQEKKNSVTAKGVFNILFFFFFTV